MFSSVAEGNIMMSAAPAIAPMAPAINSITQPDMSKAEAMIQIAIPMTRADGSALVSLSALVICHDIADHAGMSMDELIALAIPMASMPISMADAGATKEMMIADLPWATDVFFFVAVAD